MTEAKALTCSTPALLLDFDGPVCQLFAGIRHRKSRPWQEATASRRTANRTMVSSRTTTAPMTVVSMMTARVRPGPSSKGSEVADRA